MNFLVNHVHIDVRDGALKIMGYLWLRLNLPTYFVDWACCLLMMLFQWIAWINQTLRLKYFIKMQVKRLNNCRRSLKVTNILDLSFMSLSLEKVPMVLVWWSSNSCVWSWMITIWVLRGSCEYIENHLWLYHEEKSVHVTYEIDINKGDIVIGW